MFSRRREYKPVPQTITDDEKPDSDDDKRVAQLWIIGIFAITLLNLSFITYHVFFAVTDTDISNPEYRSTYIGFDLLYNKSAAPSWKPIVNKPRYLREISLVRPDEVIQPDVQYELTPDGFVSSTIEKIIINKEVSTVAQFRTIDWGMERCKLVLNVSDVTSMTGTVSSPEIDVWALDKEYPSYFIHPTWHKRPKRTKLATTFTISPGKRIESSVFPCPSASNYNFELACSATSPSCRVDLVQHEPIFFLEQSQSL